MFQIKIICPTGPQERESKHIVPMTSQSVGSRIHSKYQQPKKSEEKEFVLSTSRHKVDRVKLLASKIDCFV